MHQFFFIDYLQSREINKLARQFCHLGSGCSTVVKHTPSDQEVIGLNLTGDWALLFLYYLHLLSCISLSRSLKVVQPI